VAIWVEDADLLELGWSFLRGVALRLILGEVLISALSAELDRWRDLVAPGSTTSQSAAVGVLGELVVLRAALALGHDVTVWAGATGGPHDFRWSQIDLEVKTTTSGAHDHLINGLAQLRPVEGHELFILSLSILETELGGGTSVSGAAHVLVQEGLSETWLLATLAKRGVSLGDQESRREYVLRDTPIAVEVATDLPVVTDTVLASAFGEEARRIGDVVYRLNLDGWPSTRDEDVQSLRAAVTL
jgi:hypothetical protein